MAIAPGRYWYDPVSCAWGLEGGPPSFHLGQCPGLAGGAARGGSSSRTFCDAGGNCTSTGVLGYISTTR